MRNELVHLPENRDPSAQPPSHNETWRTNDPWNARRHSSAGGDIEPYQEESRQPVLRPDGAIEPRPGDPPPPTDEKRPRLLLVLAAVVIVLLLVVVVILAIQLSQSKSLVATPATRPPSPSSSSSSSAPPPSTASPSTSATSPSASASSTATSGPPSGVTTPYSGVTLTIPPLSSQQGQTAFVDLLIPRVSVGNVKETDLSLWSGGTWSTNNQLAELGTRAPSYSACMAVLDKHPMDLSTQTFQQGYGYCMQLTGDNEPNDVVYIKFAELAPILNAGNHGTSQVAMQVTRWNSTTSSQ